MIYLSDEVPSALYPSGHRYVAEPRGEDFGDRSEAEPSNVELGSEPVYELRVSESPPQQASRDSSTERSKAHRVENRPPPEARRRYSDSRPDLPIMEHYLGSYSSEESLTDAEPHFQSAWRKKKPQSRSSAGPARTTFPCSDEEQDMIAQQVKKRSRPLVSYDSNDEDAAEERDVKPPKLGQGSKEDGGSAKRGS